MADPSDVYQPQWWEEAECASHPNPDDFELVGKESHRTARIRLLVAEYCGNCVVAKECLEEAIEIGDRHSLRGGLTPGQRKNILRFPDGDSC